MSESLKIFDTETALFAAAAELFVESARAAVAARGRFRVALAGGSTPKALYDRLAESPYRGAVAWREVEWFWGDERSVPPEHPESNYQMAVSALLARVDVDPAKVHRLRGEAEPLVVAADEYERTLAATCGATLGGPPPVLDLVLLGMGNDGHTASLFPFTAALKEQQRWVVANDVPQLATRRLTLTYPVLNAAACVLFLVTGPAKAPILREVRQGPHDPTRLPSQAVQPKPGRLLWYVDRAAASRLE